MKDICYIVGAGECKKLYINEDNKAYIIAADGGLKYLENEGIKPDLVIGDFDSLEYIPTHENRIRLPKEKDVTDMYAAVNEGMKMGFKTFIIYGAMGGRFDHSIANCQLLNHIVKSGCKGIIVENDYAVTSIHNSNIKFGKDFKGLISIFSSGTTSKDVSIQGFKYEVTDIELTYDYPLGTSNEFVGCEGIVTVGDGTLLIIFETNPEQICNCIGTNIIFGDK